MIAKIDADWLALEARVMQQFDVVTHAMNPDSANANMILHLLVGMAHLEYDTRGEPVTNNLPEPQRERVRATMRGLYMNSLGGVAPTRPWPRADADHQLVLSTLAFLALDRPEFADVVRSLVITLYGVGALHTYDAIQQQFEPASTLAAIAKGSRLGTVNGPRA